MCRETGLLEIRFNRKTTQPQKSNYYIEEETLHILFARYIFLCKCLPKIINPLDVSNI